MHKLILDLAWGRTGDRYSSWLHHVNQNSSTNIAANMTFECLVTLTHQTRQIWQYRHWNFHPITKLDASPQFHTKKMEVGSEIPHSRIVFLKQLKVIPIFIIRLTLTNLSLYTYNYDVLMKDWAHQTKFYGVGKSHSDVTIENLTWSQPNRTSMSPLNLTIYPT